MLTIVLDTGEDASKKEIYASWALFILIMLLIVALFTSYLLQQRKITAVHETVASIFAGLSLQNPAPGEARADNAPRDGRWLGLTGSRRRDPTESRQLRLPNLLQLTTPTDYPIIRIRATPRQLLSKYRDDPYIRIRGNILVCYGHRRDPVAIHSSTPRGA